MTLALHSLTSIRPPGVQKTLAPDFSRNVYCIQGLLCDVVTLEDAKQNVMASIRERRRCNVVTPNANFLRLSRSDREFRDAALASDLSLIDGMPLVWLAHMIGIAVPGRVCGSDLCAALMSDRGKQFSAFFFGATDEIGEQVCKRLQERRCSLRCAGVLAPGFGSLESLSEPRIFETINQASPDLLVVSVGARKGVKWLSRNEHQLTAPVICNLGATINFVAGTVKRAPTSFQQHGLEWLWRIKEEPALCSRYALDLTTLLPALGKQLLIHFVQRAIHVPAATRPAEAHLQHHSAAETDTIDFVGAWTKDALGPARAALTEATRRENNLVINLDGATFVDAAFLGQILLAYGYQRRVHRSFSLCASRPRNKGLLHLHGCGYLLCTEQSSAKPISISARGGEIRYREGRRLWLWERVIGLHSTPRTKSPRH